MSSRGKASSVAGSRAQTPHPEASSDTLAYVRSIVDTVREPLVVLDDGLCVQSANRSFYRTFRVSAPETEGRRLYDLGNGQWDIPGLRRLLEEVLPDNNAFDDYEVEHDFPCLGRKFMLLNARKLRHDEADLILLAMEDVTERRRLEEERQAIETRFTSLVKNVKDHSIFTLDPDGRVTSWNIAAEHILGYTEAEVLGRHFSLIFTPEDREQGVPQAELRIAREHGRAEDERWHLRKGGERFWALGIVSALLDPEGRLTGFSKILRDMTAWKVAEQSRHESEERLRLAWLATRETIWDWDVESDRQRWSASGAETFGWTDAVNGPQTAAWWTERVHGEDRQRVSEGFRRALEDPSCERWQDEYRFLRRDGSVADVLDRGFILRDASGKPKRMIGAMQDITERKRAEAGALAAEELARARLVELEDLYRNAPVGLCLLDRDLRYLRVNARLAEINGIPPSEHIGKTVREVVPKLADTAEASLREVVETGTPRLDVEISGETAARPGVQRTWSEQWLPMKDARGQVTGISIVVEETTERKQAEEALQEANRRKDAFLATLAHELRNPLMPLRTGVDLLRTLRGDAAACERPLQIMDRQLNHLVRLVDDLLDLSRISRGKITLRKERLDLAAIIDAALEISESAIDRNDRRLSVSLPPDPLPVEGDRARLVQIVSNLLNNAAKFTDEGGHIAVRVVPVGDRVEIRVQDSGRGIPPERLADIFEMFTQTEPGHGGGLGIGLTLVRSLVAMHGGAVRADSEGLGRGAVFTVSLPLCRGTLSQAAVPDAAESVSLSRCRVLVVDDDRDVAEGLRMLLVTLKAEAEVAHDGAAALRLCADWQPTHVLMDLAMPDMDGYETARRLRAKHAERDFRLIAVSGWGQDEDRKRAQEAGFDAHLVKPVGIAELTAALSD